MATVAQIREMFDERLKGVDVPRLGYYGRTLVGVLFDEIDRLKSGNLTPEEFQNLCHNIHERGTPCTREQFEQGCKAFQDKLFRIPRENSD